MDLDIVTAMLLDVIRAHQSWAPFIVGALAFAESLAVVSLLVPSTVLLLGIGALVGANGLEFWPVWLGAAISAILGDWLSYAIGYWFKHAGFDIWPLSSDKHLSARGEQFFVKWRAWGVLPGALQGPDAGRGAARCGNLRRADDTVSNGEYRLRLCLGLCDARAGRRPDGIGQMTFRRFFAEGRIKA